MEYVSHWLLSSSLDSDDAWSNKPQSVNKLDIITRSLWPIQVLVCQKYSFSHCKLLCNVNAEKRRASRDRMSLTGRNCKRSRLGTFASSTCDIPMFTVTFQSCGLYSRTSPTSDNPGNQDCYRKASQDDGLNLESDGSGVPLARLAAESYSYVWRP